MKAASDGVVVKRVPRRWHAHQHQRPARNQGYAHTNGLRSVCRKLSKARQRSGWALRDAGAVILGKTVTAELGRTSGAHNQPV